MAVYNHEKFMAGKTISHVSANLVSRNGLVGLELANFGGLTGKGSPWLALGSWKNG